MGDAAQSKSHDSVARELLRLRQVRLMSDYSRTYARRRRYKGGRTRGGSGIGLIPVILLVLLLVAWRFHLGALPSPSAIRGFFGH